MANTKPTFAKLKVQKKAEVKTIIFNEFEIEIKQYLSIEDKFKLITNVINNSLDENNFANPIKVEMLGTLEIIYAYSNISFTEKQKEKPIELYDTLNDSGLADAIIQEIPQIEYTNIINWINECLDAYYKYKNSALGIMESIVKDYQNVDLDVSNIQQKLADPANMALLKDVLTKLG